MRALLIPVLVLVLAALCWWVGWSPLYVLILGTYAMGAIAYSWHRSQKVLLQGLMYTGILIGTVLLRGLATPAQFAEQSPFFGFIAKIAESEITLDVFSIVFMFGFWMAGVLGHWERLDELAKQAEKKGHR